MVVCGISSWLFCRITKMMMLTMRMHKWTSASKYVVAMIGDDMVLMHSFRHLVVLVLSILYLCLGPDLMHVMCYLMDLCFTLWCSCFYASDCHHWVAHSMSC